jgi:hypothetical protein
MEIKITADWVLKYMTEIQPIVDDEMGDIGLLIHNGADLKWVDMTLDQLNIPNELATWGEKNDEMVDGFVCNVIDFLKVQDEIPEFIEEIEQTGEYKRQFQDFERAMQLKSITSRIKK